MPPTIITKESLYKRITELERKHCCNKNQFFDTFAEFPAEGATNVLYIDKSNGAIYIWDGAAYSEPTSLGEGAANRVAFWSDANTLTSDVNLHYDAVNDRLGIGTATPAKSLDVASDALINGLTVGKGAGDIATNTVVGYQALNANTTGFENVTSGYNTLLNNTTGSQCVAIGHEALMSNTTGGANVAIGRVALYSNTTGLNNTAINSRALYSNTTGNSNTAVGQFSMRLNTTGSSNVAFGANSLYSNTTGNSNTAIGTQALYNNTTSTLNTAIGNNSLFSNITGGNNAAIGNNSGRYITGGGANQTSNNSLYLGYDTRASANGNTNEIVIGYTAEGLGSNTATIGNSSVTVLYLAGSVGWFQGNGTPEAAIAAPVGSFYSRKDGGAGTSFYVKESGSGNTGWVAK